MMAKRNNTIEFLKRSKVAAQKLFILLSMIVLYYLVPTIFCFVFHLLLNEKILIFLELNDDILFHNSFFN